MKDIDTWVIIGAVLTTLTIMMMFIFSQNLTNDSCPLLHQKRQKFKNCPCNFSLLSFISIINMYTIHV
ncbi:hypothetical protein DD922_15380 [Staphylococcus pseudintermedius]|nr:hypothetical protein DD922_15380 [Staphylococcus pseudintermedius]